MNLYNYFFYRRYKRWLKSKKWQSTAQYNALFDITFISWINLLTLILILKVLNNKTISEFPKIFLNKWFVIISVILLFIIHYLLLCHKGKYNTIETFFDKQDKEKIKYFN